MDGAFGRVEIAPDLPGEGVPAQEIHCFHKKGDIADTGLIALGVVEILEKRSGLPHIPSQQKTTPDQSVVYKVRSHPKKDIEATIRVVPPVHGTRHGVFIVEIQKQPNNKDKK